MFLYLTICLVLSVLVFVNYLTRDEEYEKIHGPPGIFFLENALDFFKTPGI